MKTVLKVLKWLGLAIAVLIVSILIFRNELFIMIIDMDQESKMNRPFTTLDFPPLADSTYEALASDFDKHATSPFEYVVNAFNEHDIVFLGEYHRIKHDVEFVQQLIPYLYNAGIKDMGFELSLSKDSTIIRELITNKAEFDQTKANQVFFNMSPLMGYKEYIDVLRAAWKFNKTLPDNAEPFMIHGIMHDVDFSVFKSQEELNRIDGGGNDKELMLKFRKGVSNPEKFMADCIIDNLVKKNKKALVFCGIHHSFTGYKGHGIRVGTLVKNEIGDRTMTIALHCPWASKKGSKYRLTYPVNGSIDAFIRHHKAKNYAFGIDVSETAFGKLSDTTSNYIYGDNFTLNQFCDGYIYLNPLSSIKGVSAQEHFINRKNIKITKAGFPNIAMRNGILRFIGSKGCNYLIGIDPANMEYRIRHLK